jgi:hypothetical protein
MEPKCEPVIWPPTIEEVGSELTKDRTEASVRRPAEQNPEATQSTPESRATNGVDLSAYTYRQPEAGVNVGGVWGRWFVSVTADSVIPGRQIRPAPIRLDNGRPVTVSPELFGADIGAVIRVSGSLSDGTRIDERISGPALVPELSAARTLNPHRSAVGNGRIPVGSASVLVGCTVPTIPVSVDGLDRIYNEQAFPLFRAGIQTMSWIIGPNGYRPTDLYRQIDWTLTPSASVVSGSWTETEWVYNSPGYTAYRDEIGAADTELRQPSREVSGSLEGLALNRIRLEKYLTEVADIWNRINRDSNVIRGLQILGGNSRIRQQPRRAVGFTKDNVITYGGGGGGGAVGGQFSYIYDPTTGLLREVPRPGNLN